MELKALPRVFQVDEQIIYRFLVQLLLLLLPLLSFAVVVLVKTTKFVFFLLLFVELIELFWL